MAMGIIVSRSKVNPEHTLPLFRSLYQSLNALTLLACFDHFRIVVMLPFETEVRRQILTTNEFPLIRCALMHLSLQPKIPFSSL